MIPKKLIIMGFTNSLKNFLFFFILGIKFWVNCVDIENRQGRLSQGYPEEQEVLYMLCPQCSAPMVRKSHSGQHTSYFTLNCNHCKFVIFFRGRFANFDEY